MGRLFRSKRRGTSDLARPHAETAQPEPGPAGEGDLAERLKRLDWPTPDPAVRDRCLERILERVEAGELASRDSA